MSFFFSFSSLSPLSIRASFLNPRTSCSVPTSLHTALFVNTLCSPDGTESMMKFAETKIRTVRRRATSNKMPLTDEQTQSKTLPVRSHVLAVILGASLGFADCTRTQYTAVGCSSERYSVVFALNASKNISCSRTRLVVKSTKRALASSSRTCGRALACAAQVEMVTTDVYTRE